MRPNKTSRCPKQDYGAQNFKTRRKESSNLLKAPMPALAPKNPTSQARKKISKSAPNFNKCGQTSAQNKRIPRANNKICAKI